MGAWSAVILGNDSSCEVRDRFFELYNKGKKPECIADLVLEEQSDNLQYERTNIWLGLALACWECKVLSPEILSEIKKIIETKEDIQFNKELDADNTFLKKRQNYLDKFLIKISTEKEKARKIIKPPIKAKSIYLAGMCLAYKNSAENYIGIYLTKSEHFRNKGKIVFFFLDFESHTLPNLEMFNNSKLFGITKLGPEWGCYEYQGNVTDIDYEKNTCSFRFKLGPVMQHF
jgi:hypothetical protein